ncbi:hypothetical protein NE612_01180 [Oscillibacter valericigenes]|nr:hypothetical protein [Oscillibacter valericigenes]
MQDGIMKGTGNSRYLKSIADFLTQYPTYQEFAAALAAGTLPVDLNGINETGWEQLGTALNKANLLSDETAALFPGLPENPMPNDVFGKIGTFMDENTYLEKVNEFEATEDSDVFAFAVTENDLHETFIVSISGISGNNAPVKLSSPYASSRRYSTIQAGSDYIFNSTTTSIVIDQQHPSFFAFRFSGTVSGSNAVEVQIIVHDINGIKFFNCTGSSDNYKTAIFSIDLNIGQSLKIYRVVK